ncbi:MAG: hypothetical protein ACI4UA_04795 [Bacteroidaceae bacterium]
MKRLLSLENKRSIEEAFRTNPVFRIIKAAYKEQETQMSTLHFSPEEIWANCFYGFDKILKNREEAEDVTGQMWDDTFCELRDEANDVGRDFHVEELETATSCIIYAIVACLTACGDWKLEMHTFTLMNQISRHSHLDSVTRPFDRHLDDSFIQYVKEYTRVGRFISDQLDSPHTRVDPVNHTATPRDKIKAMEGIRGRLAFMKSVIPDSETPIMTAEDHVRMIEAVEYLIENNVVKKQANKISTRLPVAHLRYTFYLVFKNEGKCIRRDLWVEFLGETFRQMQANKTSLSNHFADRPKDYGKYAQG